MKKLIIITLIILVAAFGAYKIWGKKVLSPQGQAAGAAAAGGFSIPVEAFVVKPVPWDITLNTIGSLAGNEAANVKAEVAGRIEKINFIEGQAVDKGSVLVELDDALIRAELSRAQAAFTLADANYTRRKDLIEIGAIAAQEGDQYLAAMQDAQAALNFANTRLAKTKIRAPFDGIAGLRSISLGDYLDVGSLVTEVVSINPIKLEFTVPEKYQRDMKLNQTVKVEVDGFPGKIFDGEIYAIDPSIDVDTRSIRLKAMVYNNDELLKPGMFARLNLLLEKRDGIMAVPEQSILPVGTKSFVYRIVDGKATKTEVTIGDRKGGMVEIVSGLNEGEQVITAGVVKVQDGTPVMTMEQMQKMQAGNTAKPDAPKEDVKPTETTAEKPAEKLLPDNPFTEEKVDEKTADTPATPKTDLETIFGKDKEKPQPEGKQ